MKTYAHHIADDGSVQDYAIPAGQTIAWLEEQHGITLIPGLSTQSFARTARDKRNTMLAKSDWRDLPSYPGTDQAAWRSYRQELRDISTQADFPSTVSWPTEPG